MKPVIGITSNYSTLDIGTPTQIGVSGQHWDVLAHDYTRSVEAAGGLPLIFPLYRDPEMLIAAAGLCDGILISGGNDVSPQFYGQAVSSKTGQLVPARDSAELRLTRHLLENTNKPVLGICRGIQVMNVAMGGTLCQDLTSRGKDHTAWGVPLDSFAHRVYPKRGTRLAEILGTEPLWVNSYHHQAVDQLAEAFTVGCMAEDEVVEAIELAGRRFVLAVQWHPEMLDSCPNAAKVMRAFVGACEK